MPEHTGDSSSLIEFQGSSSKSTFEKPPVSENPRKKPKTDAEGRTSAICIYFLLFFFYFLATFSSRPQAQSCSDENSCLNQRDAKTSGCNSEESS